MSPKLQRSTKYFQNKTLLKPLRLYNKIPIQRLAISRIIVYRLMNRQELFHGNKHLSIVSRRDQGYAAQVLFSLPLVTPMNF